MRSTVEHHHYWSIICPLLVLFEDIFRFSGYEDCGNGLLKFLNLEVFPLRGLDNRSMIFFDIEKGVVIVGSNNPSH